MTTRLEVYKCSKCGAIVQVLEGGKGQLYCCEEPMNQVIENTIDASKEKHIPVVFEKNNEKNEVQVGTVAHPMNDDHYIQWVELVTDNKSFFKFFSSSENPEFIFQEEISDDLYARAYCNIHGLWKSKKRK